VDAHHPEAVVVVPVVPVVPVVGGGRYQSGPATRRMPLLPENKKIDHYAAFGSVVEISGRSSARSEIRKTAASNQN